MSPEKWHLWFVSQSMQLIGAITPFMQGQRDVYDQVDADMCQHRLDITLEWIMQRMAEEERRVHLSAQDPPERSYHLYRQGRLTAYQHMRLQLV